MKKKLGYILAGLIIGYLYFNRCPDRKISSGDNIVSPTDGTITSIQDNKINIFIGITDVHCQRSPYDGIITQIIEPNPTTSTIYLSTSLGDIIIERSAGTLARTIRTYYKVGDFLKKGDVFGKILLGSHCSIILPNLPLNWQIKVNTGQHLTAGETIIAQPI